MGMRCVLGIDTSNYTTSVCAVSLDALTDTCVFQARKLLPVQEGERGLRQSDALFFHVQQLPTLISEMMGNFHRQGVTPEWAGVGVSVRPRPFATSYMPVFHAGRSFAHSFAGALGIPVLQTSHQEGHVAAADFFLNEGSDDPFLAVHISGGTSDVLLARRTQRGYEIRLLGEGADLHAGQFVDRVGVMLGLPFPAGPHLERLAKSAPSNASLRFPVSSSGAQMSFSGPCSAALRAVQNQESPAEIARAVEAAVATAVVKSISNAYTTVRQTITRVVVAGGVAANVWITERIVHRLRILHPQLFVQFAPPEYSSDNALGVAHIAQRFFSSPKQ